MKGMKGMKIQMAILFIVFTSSPAIASGGSAMSFSLMMFIFFGFAGWIISSIVKHQLKNKNDTVLNRIRKILPITILVSPSFYIDSPGVMILPSAANIGASIDPMNITSLISCFISILLTTLGIYFYKYKKTETMQIFDDDENV